jgi:hypothetical protein
MITRKTLAAVLVGSFVSHAGAEERDEFLKVKKSTLVNLIDLLVQRGVLEKQDAKGLMAQAEEEARAEEAKEAARQRSAGDTAQAQPSIQEEQAGAQDQGGKKGKKGGKSIHVSYVPEFVKQEIRDQVRAELKADVLKDVKTHARNERWGIPDALPDWVSRITPYFDARIRLADEFYGSGNAQFFDWLQINQDGGISQALAKNRAFLNTTIDRLRVRERFRIGFDARITDGLKAGFRFATSNMFNPVSNDQTLGNTGQSWQFAIDRGFLQYDFVDSQGNDWFTLAGGRIANPFVSTDVVYDPDLSFEGVAGSFRWRFSQDDPTVRSYHAHDPNGRFGVYLGPQTPNTVFATAGVFPIQEVDFSASDKWLFGGQIGADWLVFDQSRLTVAASYYHYKNISAKRNDFESNKYDWSAPQFIQKGNSLVAINDAKNQPDCATGSLGAQNVCLVGLASGFQIFNATAIFDYAGFAPTHIMLTGDYAKNLGFDENKIFREFGDRIAPKTNAYQVRIDVGRPELKHFNDWSVYFAYRYLERDAVLDAFTDSVFHQGGTDAKGWVVGAQYGLAKNTWLNLRWFSTDSIDGPPLSVDTLNLDLNARF